MSNKNKTGVRFSQVKKIKKQRGKNIVESEKEFGFRFRSFGLVSWIKKLFKKIRSFL